VCTLKCYSAIKMTPLTPVGENWLKKYLMIVEPQRFAAARSAS